MYPPFNSFSSFILLNNEVLTVQSGDAYFTSLSCSSYGAISRQSRGDEPGDAFSV